MANIMEGICKRLRVLGDAGVEGHHVQDVQIVTGHVYRYEQEQIYVKNLLFEPPLYIFKLRECM